MPRVWRSTAVRLRAIDEHRGAAIVRALAKEESAKVLILLDLVRCPRNNQDGKSRTVAAFRDHLAKEIYADSCCWRPVDFAEVTRIVNRERRPYYLDGPNGVDWIHPNYTKGRRDNRMYVDYVQDITVEGGEYDWVSPLPDSLYREYKRRHTTVSGGSSRAAPRRHDNTGRAGRSGRPLARISAAAADNPSRAIGAELRLIGSRE